MKIDHLRALIREEIQAATPAPAGGGNNLNKLIEDIANQFVTKTMGMYPSAEQAIRAEAEALKTQLTAQIKASFAKVKTSVPPQQPPQA